MTKKENEFLKKMVLWRIPDDADGPEKVQNGQKQGSAHPEAESRNNGK